MSGVGAASVLESLHYARFMWRKQQQRLISSGSSIINSSFVATAWRFLPDGIAIGAGLLLSTITHYLDYGPGAKFLATAGIQIYFTGFFLVTMLQDTPEAR